MNTVSTSRSTRRSALLLGSCALLAVALLAGVHSVTRERIAAQQLHAQLAALHLVLPPSLYDNDPIVDRIDVLAPAWLGSAEPLRVWRARRDGNDTALVLEAVAPDGYSGPIGLLIGVRADGTLNGVRVTAHQETPGLGDKLEAGKSDWITRLTGRSLRDPVLSRWRVRRDGGEFDQFAGATVTPRALLAAVRRALLYVQAHGDELYRAAPDSMLEHRDVPQG